VPEIGTSDLIAERDSMEFRLLYEGTLNSSGGSNTRPDEKHAIRRSFHPQLRRLWRVQPNLREIADRYWIPTIQDPTPKPTTEDERFELGIESIGRKWARCGFQFVPLVTPDMNLRCSLDIVLLRPEEDRYIFRRGDIDGQLKTLFDALRLPDNVAETGSMMPQEDETPFYCLLQDDRLISEIRVTTGQLLVLPNEREVRANDVHVSIHVRLNHKNARSLDNYFG
jgi:hypothetical protein